MKFIDYKMRTHVENLLNRIIIGVIQFYPRGYTLLCRLEKRKKMSSGN